MKNKNIIIGSGSAIIGIAMIIIILNSGGGTNENLLIPLTYYENVLNCTLIENTLYENYSFNCSGDYSNGAWKDVELIFVQQSVSNRQEKSNIPIYKEYSKRDGSLKNNLIAKTNKESKKVINAELCTKFKDKEIYDSENKTYHNVIESYTENMYTYLYEHRILIDNIEDGDLVKIGNNSTVINFTTQDVLMNNTVNSVNILNKSIFLIASNAGIDEINTASNLCNTSHLGDKAFFSVESNPFKIFAGASDGLYIFNASTCFNYSTQPYLLDGRHINAISYSNISGIEYVLAGTDTNVSFWNMSSNKVFNSTLSNPKAVLIYGSTILYSNSTNLLRKNSLPTADFTADNSTIISNIQAISATSGFIYAGTPDGLFRINSTSFINDYNFTVENGRLKTNSNNVTSLSFVNNNLFIGVN